MTTAMIDLRSDTVTRPTDAMLDVVGPLLDIEELQRSKQHSIHAHAPEGLPVQLVALEAVAVADQ